MIDLSTVYAFLERIPLHILCQCVYFAFLFFLTIVHPMSVFAGNEVVFARVLFLLLFRTVW